MKNVRVRFAPSPTGNPHIGNIRTALFTYLFAKSNNGVFVLRIEDTDKKREQEESFQAILDSLKWLGLIWDEGPFIQSERLTIYQEHARELVAKNGAYYCFCTEEELAERRAEATKARLTPRYNRRCRNLSKVEVDKRLAKGEKAVIRLKVPETGTIKFKDLVHGEISIDLSNVDDQVLVKSDGFPTYHLASVVDDHLMEITHVTRGDDWISSTPKHLLLYQLFGWEPPLFAHFPLILGSDKSKLSKRHGAVGVLDFKNLGYLPEAIINYLVLLGWSPKTDQEIFSLEELEKIFKLEHVNATNPIFSYDKLNWFNGHYLRQASDEKLADLLKPFVPEGMNATLFKATIPLVKERITKLDDYRGMVEFFVTKPKVNTGLLDKKQLEATVAVLEKVEWNKETLEKVLQQLVKDNNWHTGKFFMNLRIAVTGKKISPPLMESMVILGLGETLARLKNLCVFDKS